MLLRPIFPIKNHGTWESIFINQGSHLLSWESSIDQLTKSISQEFTSNTHSIKTNASRNTAYHDDAQLQHPSSLKQYSMQNSGCCLHPALENHPLVDSFLTKAPPENYQHLKNQEVIEPENVWKLIFGQ